MSDEGQEPPQNQNTPPDTGDQPPEPTEPKTFDEDYVKELRQESAKYRKELRAAQKRLDEIEKAQAAAEQAELEKQGEYKELADKARAEAETMRQELEAERQKLAGERRNSMAVSAATALGAIDPTDANFQTAVSHIDINSEDAEAEIRQALEGLKERRPYLFQGNRPGLSSFNPSGDRQEQGPPGETDDERRARLFGAQSRRFFDRQAAEVAGGGVVWPKGKPEER